jgi:HEAT repeats
MTFYCPICWSEVSKDDRTCKSCGTDLASADARPMLEKLCSALSHCEPETAVRAAWILGEGREKRAVPELTRAVETTSDGFLAEAAADALGKIADPCALECLNEAGRTWTRARTNCVPECAAKNSKPKIGSTEVARKSPLTQALTHHRKGLV